jgi:tRNA 5-methylaminomethyl-2-thiouridine biosynthesis bifunctional protein
MAAILAVHAFPNEYVRWIEAGEAAQLARHRVAGPGWWIPDGGWARPQALCRSLLAGGADRIRARFGSNVNDLEPCSAGWRARDAGGEVLAQAPVLVIANGYDARHLALPGLPMLIGVRGQVSFVSAAPSRRLGVVVCGDGYIAPLPGGGHCIGATFEPGVDAVDVRADDHASNLQRAQRMLPGFARGIDPTRLAGWAGVRAATADRIPACGALDSGTAPGHDGGCYAITGMGARGLVWAPLCAEVLASHLEGEPNPIERSLVAAMDPLRQYRRFERAG